MKYICLIICLIFSFLTSSCISRNELKQPSGYKRISVNKSIPIELENE